MDERARHRRDADVLLHDGQYRDQEYPAHVGWGHSGIGDAMEFADKADVGRLVLFHHDPYHTDDELETLLADARASRPAMDDRISLAYEGMTIVFDDAGVIHPRLAGGSGQRPTAVRPVR